MKLIRGRYGDKITVFGYSLWWVVYGKYNSFYIIEYVDPSSEAVFKLYRSEKKPIFRNLPLLILLLVPLALLSYIAFLVYMIIYFIFCFYNQTLLRESFITARYEKISGILSFILTLVGIYQVIRWIF